MSKPLNVLISGSGIAGSAFAFWLLKAYPDANITIVERDPSLRLTGASVDIRSSAVDIIKWMGAEPEIRKHTTQEAGVQFVRGDGTAIATMAATGRDDMQSFTSEFEIFRGALAQIFIDLVLKQNASVKMVFDEFVESYEQSEIGDGVVVTFAKSKEKKTYDLLVAADGLGSKIRGMMLGTRPREQVYGEAAYASYFTVNGDLLEGSKLAKWYNTTRGRCIFLRPDPNPEGRTRAIFVNVPPPGKNAMKDRLENALHEGHESYKALLEDEFSDAGWLAPKVLRGMGESTDFYSSLFAQVRSPKLVDGRVVLLGDAGYATPGIGTSLAIIGGYVLAGELLNAPGRDVTVAAKNYEALMVPFVKGAQSTNPNAVHLLNPQTQWGLTVRDTIFSWVTWLKIDRLAMAVGARLGVSEKKLAMPRYPWPSL